MELEKLVVYQQAMELGEGVWAVVVKWDYFAKDTVGKQLVKAADSVAANISEGYGRYHFKENRQFCYYSRGSLYETRTWLKKAHKRELLSTDQYKHLFKMTFSIAKLLNGYIRSIGRLPNTNDQ